MKYSAGSSDPPARALLAAGTANYEWPEFGDLDKVSESLQIVCKTLTGGNFGFVTADDGPAYRLDPPPGDLKEAIHEAADGAPIVVFYYSGHGVQPERGRYYLVSHASRPADLHTSAVATTELPELLLRRNEDGEVSPTQPEVLLILDCCHSGSAGTQLLSDALRDIGNPNTWMIASAGGLEYARQGLFAAALRDALDMPTAGPSMEFLSLDSIVHSINQRLEGKTEQRARIFPPASGTASIPPFFRNPDYARGLAGRPVDEQQHWLSRLRGAPTSVGYYVTGHSGRLRAIEELATWMADSYDSEGLAVVTGSPGTGKSTVLALPVLLTHEALRNDLLSSWDESDPMIQRAAGLLPTDLVIVPVHARGLNTDQAARVIARGLGRTASTASQLSADLDTTPQQDRRVVVVDAVDEAVSPATMLSLLIRLARQPGIAVAVGARPQVIRQLRRFELMIDLDVAEYRDPEALVRYVTRLLIAAEEPDVTTPYQQADQRELALVAAAIARRATTDDGTVESFLIAQQLARSVRGRAEPVNTQSADWQSELPDTLAEAFEEDFGRLGGRRLAQTRALLRALAWSNGPGLPWESIWVPVARALESVTAVGGEPSSVHDGDVRSLLDSAGAYIVEDVGPGGRSVYRPYHDLLADHLRRQTGPDEIADTIEGAITEALVGTVSADPMMRRRWRPAHPYLRSYLAEHASAAGQATFLDLLHDDGFLAAADPVTLGPLLDSAPEARDVARIYRRARPLLTADISANAAYLQEASHTLLGARASTGADDVRPRYRTSLASAVRDESVHALTGHTTWIQSVAIVGRAAGRPLLASGDAAGMLRWWNPLTGVLAGQAFTDATGPIESVALGVRVDGRVVLASGNWDRTVRLWDPATGLAIGEPLTGHEGAVFAMAFGVDANGSLLLASGSSDGTVRLWDPVRRVALGEPLAGHTGSVFSVAFGVDADGTLVLASGSSDGTVRLWDPAALVPRGNPTLEHGGAVRSVAFGPGSDGRLLLASGGSDGSVRRWDPRTGDVAGSPLTGHEGAVSSMAIVQGNGGPILVSGSWDRTVRLWDIDSGAQIGEPLTGHNLSVSSVAATTTADGRLLIASGSWDRTVRLWESTTAASAADAGVGHSADVGAVAFGTESGGRLLLASGSDDRTVRLWDPVAGAPIRGPLVGHTAEVGSVTFGTVPDRHLLLASGGWDHTVRLWDAATGEPVGQPLTGHISMAVYSVASATGQDGRLTLASAGDDNTVRIWDLASGTGTPLTDHRGQVYAVAFGVLDDGGLLLASAGADHVIRLWDPVSGALTGMLDRHTGPVRTLSFARGADGRLVLASGGSDMTVRVWDPLSGASIGEPFTEHSEPVRTVTFLAGGSDKQTLLASGSDDRTIRLWEPDSTKSIVTLRRRSPVRSMTSAGRLLAIGDKEGVSVIELDWS